MFYRDPAAGVNRTDQLGCLTLKAMRKLKVHILGLFRQQQNQPGCWRYSSYFWKRKQQWLFLRKISDCWRRYRDIFFSFLWSIRHSCGCSLQWPWREILKYSDDLMMSRYISLRYSRVYFSKSFVIKIN